MLTGRIKPTSSKKIDVVDRELDDIRWVLRSRKTTPVIRLIGIKRLPKLAWLVLLSQDLWSGLAANLVALTKKGGNGRRAGFARGFQSLPPVLGLRPSQGSTREARPIKMRSRMNSRQRQCAKSVKKLAERLDHDRGHWLLKALATWALVTLASSSMVTNPCTALAVKTTTIVQQASKDCTLPMPWSPQQPLVRRMVPRGKKTSVGGVAALQARTVKAKGDIGEGRAIAVAEVEAEILQRPGLPLELEQSLLLSMRRGSKGSMKRESEDVSTLDPILVSVLKMS